MLIKNLNFDLKMIYDVLYHFSCFSSLINAFNKWIDVQNQIVKQIKNQEQNIKTFLTVLFTNMISFDKTTAQLHQKKSVILTCHERNFKATTFVYDVCVENQKAHFLANTPFVMSVFKSMKIKCPMLIINITSKSVFFVNLTVVLFDSNFFLRTNGFWSLITKAREKWFRSTLF